jgi:hypothetical protein
MKQMKTHHRGLGAAQVPHAAAHVASTVQEVGAWVGLVAVSLIPAGHPQVLELTHT